MITDIIADVDEETREVGTLVLIGPAGPDLGEFSSRSQHDLVGIDNVAAAIELTQHMLSRGRKRICFLARPNFPSTTDLRMLGCLEALRRSGIGSKYAFAHFGDQADINFVRRVLDCSNPDAVIRSNDQTAVLLIRSLAQLKKHVPEQIAVAGFDDVQYAMLLSPPLTPQSANHAAKSPDPR